jgi:hypothetical protein
MFLYKKLIFTILFIMLSASASAGEYRCGWLENPTPGNIWLTDSVASWTISTQGGYQIKDKYLKLLPKTHDNEFVRTNGHYGYSCACINMKTDKKTKRVSKIYSKGKSLLLKQCLEDRNLGYPGR